MMELVDFIRESNRIEGIVREPYEGEIDAHREFLALTEITVADIQRFVGAVAAAPLRSEPGMDVQVGNHIPPRGGREIVLRLENLLAYMEKHGAYKTHLAYEKLHPFMDGNGRSGRALWLWMMDDDVPLGFLHKFYYQTLEAS